MDENKISGQPIVDKEYLLQKHPGKGGWTYAIIPEINKNNHAWFGSVKVSGKIDSYELFDVNLMPMGNGILFLPVKAEIRKSINKNEGDWVHIKLFKSQQDFPEVQVEDFITCLKEEKIAFENFNKKTKSEQQEIIDWIFSAKRDELKIERIALSIDKLLNIQF